MVVDFWVPLQKKGHIITVEYCKNLSYRFSQVLYKEKWGEKQCVDKDIGGLKTVVCSVLIFLKRTL